MQPPALLRVSRGLALVHWGFRLIAGAVISLVAVFAVTGLIEPFNHGICFVCSVLMLTFVIPIPIAIGILVGVIGRPFCLRTPPELRIARVRIRLSVILEGCGLMMALMNGALAFTVAYVNNVLPYSEVVMAVFAFSIVLFIAGRVFFLTYTVALAKVVDMKLVTRPSGAAILVIVAGSTVFGTALCLASTRGRVPITLFEVLTAGGAMVVALCVFGTLYVYGRHLRRLRAAVKQFNIQQVEHVED